MTTATPPEVPQRLMTVEEFAALPNDGRRLDLVRGVVVDRDEGAAEVSRPKYRHGVVAANLMILVGGFVKAQKLGQVATESGFIVARNPDTLRGPDFAFVPNERALAEGDRDCYFPGAPDLAVEIVSPNDTLEEARALIDEYFAAGARMVWVIHPLFKAVEVHRPNGTVSVLRANDTLDGEDVLPGFTTLVSALFE